MKKFILFATITLTLMACGNKTVSHNETADEIQQDSVATMTCKDLGRDSYTFSTSFRENEEGQCDALILTCKSGEKVQEFACEFNWPKDKELLSESGSITEEDINFDGTPDLLVLLGDFGVNPELFPSLFYAAFIWDNETQSFERVEKLDNVTNLEVDAKNHVITSDYMNVVGDEFHEVYAWKNGKLELKEESRRNAIDEEIEE